VIVKESIDNWNKGYFEDSFKYVDGVECRPTRILKSDGSLVATPSLIGKEHESLNRCS
jgi:hypothetical protein